MSKTLLPHELWRAPALLTVPSVSPATEESVFEVFQKLRVSVEYCAAACRKTIA